jgi:hypothetical protein
VPQRHVTSVCAAGRTCPRSYADFIYNSGPCRESTRAGAISLRTASGFTNGAPREDIEVVCIARLRSAPSDGARAGNPNGRLACDASSHDLDTRAVGYVLRTLGLIGVDASVLADEGMRGVEDWSSRAGQVLGHGLSAEPLGIADQCRKWDAERLGERMTGLQCRLSLPPLDHADILPRKSSPLGEAFLRKPLRDAPASKGSGKG